MDDLEKLRKHIKRFYSVDGRAWHTASNFNPKDIYEHFYDYSVSDLVGLLRGTLYEDAINEIARKA